MKNIRFLVFILTISTLVLSACGGAATPTPNVGSGKVEALPVAFIGTVDSIAGDQWVISGTTVTVDPAVVRDGPFAVGNQVKVEGVVNPDGSFTVSRVEVPTPQDVSTLPQFGDDNSNDANANDDANVNINESNINDGNINDDNSNGVNSNDDNSNSTNSNDSNINDDNSGGNGNSNDDKGGGNSNDDKGGGNSNDDKGGGNSNDD